MARAAMADCEAQAARRSWRRGEDQLRQEVRDRCRRQRDGIVRRPGHREEARRRGQDQLHQEVRDRRRRRHAAACDARPPRRSWPVRPRRASPRSAWLTPPPGSRRPSRPRRAIRRRRDASPGAAWRRSHKLAPWNAPSRRAPRAVLFDAYGTLFDVYSVGVVAERLFPGAGERLGILWRDKQIEYTRLTSMSGQARSFRDCTRAGLRYAARRFDLALDDARRARADGRLRAARAVRREPRRPRRAAPARRARRHPQQRRPRHARGGRPPRRLRRAARPGPERRGHRPVQDRPGDLRPRHARARPRRRRGAVRLEQLLGRDRRDLVRLHDALDQPLRPAPRRARRPADADRHAARPTSSTSSPPKDPRHDAHPARRAGDQRADPARLRDHPDRARRSTSSPSCTAPSSRAASSCSPSRAERARRLDAGERPDFLAAHRGDPRRRLEDRAGAAGAAMPPRRDHRPGRREDGHQRLQLGRRLVHDRLRGFELAVVDEPDPGPDQHRPGDPRARSSFEQQSPAGTQDATSSTTRSRRCRCGRAAGTSTRST